MSMLDEKKSEPTDYRRGGRAQCGCAPFFVGIGIYALGAFALGRLFEELLEPEELVGLIGLGIVIAGYGVSAHRQRA